MATRRLSLCTQLHDETMPASIAYGAGQFVVFIMFADFNVSTMIAFYRQPSCGRVCAENRRGHWLPVRAGLPVAAFAATVGAALFLVRQCLLLAP